jgi:hypothetical protein
LIEPTTIVTAERADAPNGSRTGPDIGGRWDNLHPGTLSYQTVEDNLVFDDNPDWARLETDGEGRPTSVIFEDPAAVEKIGFQPLAFDRMGLYADPRRASWPVAREVEPVSFAR